MKRIVRNEVVQSDNIAIADDKGNVITYKELAKEAERLSQFVEKRSLIFILCDHQFETVKLLYEILYLNRIALLLAEDIDKELLNDLITIYQPQYIYCNSTCETGRHYCHVVKFEQHMLLKTDNRRYPIHQDVALLLSTSGTTGSSKLVKLSYENLYNNAEYADLHLGVRSGHKGLSPLPVHYTYGFAFCLWHWHCGATLLITKESAVSNKFNEFYMKEKINNFAATPYTYEVLQRVRFWDPEKVKYLHFAMSGGAQLSEQVQIDMIAIMRDKFWIGYGQTECTCIISGASFKSDNLKLGTVGKAFDNMHVLTDSESNELIIKSRSVCMGYANDIAQLADGDRNRGILHTGDVVYMDDEGYIYLRGRLARYVKVLGNRVNLDDVEKYLKNKFKDADFACIGIDNQLSIFYSAAESSLDAEIALVLDRNMKIPHKFVLCRYLESIPRNAAGKIMYANLEEMSNEGKDTEYL